MYDCLVKIRWSVYISKSQRSLCVSFFRTDVGLCRYCLFVWSNLNFLHNYQWITLPTQRYLALSAFCTSLRHSFIIWLVVLSVFQDNLHLLFCCVFFFFFFFFFLLLLLLLVVVVVVVVTFYSFWVFSQWSLSDYYSFQVSGTHMSISIDLRNSVIWIGSSLFLIINSTTIGITATFMLLFFSVL